MLSIRATQCPVKEGKGRLAVVNVRIQMLVREDSLTKEKDQCLIEDEVDLVECVFNQEEQLECYSMADTLKSQRPLM